MKNVLARIIQITQLSRMSSHYVKTSQSVFSFKACIRLKLQRVLYWMERIQVLLMRAYISFPKANFIFLQFRFFELNIHNYLPLYEWSERSQMLI